MLKRFRNKAGQSLSAEVVIVFVVVVVAISAMSVYVRRALQARARDLVIYARDEAVGALDGSNVFLQYEPYYVNTMAKTTQDITSTININATGWYIQDTFQDRIVTANAVQAPPKDWD